ncbi:MAG TPA: imelysin family protein [Acidimicrobiia bacterium]|nr:imelysin family protein [Acidimicrobiia bacterium]
MQWRRSAVVVMASAVVLSACGSDANEDLQGEVVANYAALVHESYAMSVASATEMDAAIDALAADPTAASLDAARAAWLAARDDYGPTEAFRFYGGPIDAEETGVEGLINAWPLDEAYIDYVEGAPESGLVNLPDDYPTIDAELLVSLNEVGGETNISTGWHAIEFLLWGQDLADEGPGARSVDDFTTAPNADRRLAYLTVASDLLLDHLRSLVDAWAPDVESNYRAEFVALPSEEALGMILTGIGELSRGELAGERLTVAYEEHSQEDEHSCFSDNTTSDIVANAAGIERVYHGSLGDVAGPGIHALVAAIDADLATRLEEEIAASVAAAESIPAPFDQSLAPGVPDDDPGRVAIQETILALELQSETMVEAADLLGLELNLS